MSTNEKDSTDEKENSNDLLELAQVEFDKDNFFKCIEILNKMKENKIIAHNKAISEFNLDNNLEKLKAILIFDQETDLMQQTVIDYNRSILLIKHEYNYDEAINILDKRIKSLNNALTLIDENIIIKLYYLLSLVYIECKRCSSKAINLLQYLTEKYNLNQLPINIQQMKARCFLQLGSTKAAKRELKAISGEPYLRSYLELLRNNLKKAMKIFNGITNKDSLIYANNEALIQFYSGKKVTATYLLSKAISNMSNIVGESDVNVKTKKLLPINSDAERLNHMLYNLALMNLFTGNVSNANNIFYKLILRYPKNARLWFRLSECIIEENFKINPSDNDVLKVKQSIVSGYFGSGLCRKLVLQSCLKENTNDIIKSKLNNEQTMERLLFARNCLLNALSLIKSDELDYYPSNQLNEQEFTKFNIAVLLSLSYVNILLNDYYQSYRYSFEALQLNPIGYQKILAHLYAGESLIWLDEISEAIDHFSPDIIQSEPINIPTSTTANTSSSTTTTAAAASSQENQEIQTPLNSTVSFNVNTAKVLIIYNLSVAYALRGEYQKAGETLRQVTVSLSSPDTTIPVQVVMLAIYIQLQNGYTDYAKSLIKQHLPQFR